MEGVRATYYTAGNGQLDSGVGRKVVDTSGRQEVVCVERSVQDLQEHRDGRRDKRCVIDEELRSILASRSEDGWFICKEIAYEGEVEVQSVVNAALKWKARLKSPCSQTNAASSNRGQNLLHAGP